MFLDQCYPSIVLDQVNISINYISGISIRLTCRPLYLSCSPPDKPLPSDLVVVSLWQAGSSTKDCSPPRDESPHSSHGKVSHQNIATVPRPTAPFLVATNIHLLLLFHVVIPVLIV